MDTDFLDWALTDFSGYVAADELYDGPFCMLSVVDNRCYKRLLYDVLDHDPTHEDIRAFLGRLKTALSARALTLFGVTTDGSALSPEPLLEVFGDVPHQICEFHIVAEVAKAVLGAVASARKALAAKQPKLGKGRPSTPAASRRPARKSGWQGKAPRCSPHDICSSSVTSTKPNGRPYGASAVDYPSYRRCVRSWSRCTRYSIGVAGPRPLWTNSRHCGGGFCGSPSWVRRSRSSFRPRWKRP